MPSSLLVISNAAAGNAHDAALAPALDVLRRRYDVEVRATADLDDLSRVLRGRRDRDVVVVGGDGSLHAVVQGLHRLGDLDRTVVGLIPLGTGNDFARTLKIPPDPERAAQVIVSGHRRHVDVLVDDQGGVVVNAVHAGVGAAAAAAARRWKHLGRIGYGVGAAAVGLKASGRRIRVVADGRVLADGRRPVLQVAIGNGPLVGGGVPLIPDADPSDGVAHVLVSAATGKVERLMYALRLRQGRHDERSDVTVASASAVFLAAKRFWCSADGEVLGPLTSRTWTVRPSALTVFCPSSQNFDLD